MKRITLLLLMLSTVIVYAQKTPKPNLNKALNSWKEGKLDEIAVSANPGVSDDRLVSQIKEILPPATQVRTGQAQAHEDAKDTNDFISFLQKFLLGFGGVALFVGSFVIANSLSITIAQRTREFATVRTIGGSRRQILT